MSDLTFFEQAMLVIIGVAATGISGAIMAYFRSRSQCFKAWQDLTEKLDKRSFRQSQAMIVMAGVIERQTEKAHPGEGVDGLSSEIEKLLKDEDGKL